jgi:dolichyl-phosphooligosaccharide-protein glycotransferase
MISLDWKNRRIWWIAGLVTLFSLFALWLRLLPMFGMGNIDNLSLVASDDPLYNLRQVEFLLANHLNYQWFDPMTLYPTGSNIYWGPLFPTIIAICCLITGATTRPEIISVGLIICPLIGAALVAIMYFVGKTCGDWKTGLFASAFTAVVTGQFFYRSLYGYMDHHIAEVLFSTIFCLFYMYTVFSEKDTKIDLKNIHTYKKALLFSALAGIAYLLGFFVMPTIILFAMIAGIFTVVQFIIDTHRGRTSEYLLVLNGTIFAIAIVGFLLFGFKSALPELSTYSIAHIYADLGMIGGTAFLYILQKYLKGKAAWYYPAAIAGSVLVFLLALYLVSPTMFTLIIVDSFAFFGQAAVTNTVQEARGWALSSAWTTFNYGLILMAGGFLAMCYNNIRNERPEQVFAVIWSVVTLYSTWQHVRYEYYLAINVALLSAVCASFVLERSWPAIRQMFAGMNPAPDAAAGSKNEGEESGGKRKKQKKVQKTTSADKGSDFVIIGVSVIVVGLAILFAYTSITYSYTGAVSHITDMTPDWKESMEWMANNTPDTGVGYFTYYDKNTFSYPNGSYGVMSWWDYGHLITTIGKRIPNANPFQQGVAGDTGAAAYFMATSEDTADTILDKDGTRYIVTDVEMDQGKFWAMSTWFNATAAADPYYDTLLLQGSDGSLSAATLNKQLYYLTMISRLHNFDGSMTEPGVVYYVVSADTSVYQTSYPVIMDAMAMNLSQATQKAAEYNRNAKTGYHATVYSPSLIAPVDTVPALQHYRLVHESPTNVYNSKTTDLKYVKVFEYVKGAHIKGEGTIEVPVVSDTGRNYTYRQASVNGEFIVPYATTGNPYDVKTTGKYTVVGTGKQYDVPESAVMQGLTVQ